MKTIGKYNLLKGCSTLLTIGTPIVTLACCASTFLKTPTATVSATGVFALLIAALFFKDKLAENFKMPSAFVVSAIVFVLVVLVESIIEPIKYVCVASMIACGIDEVSFKRLYKRIENFLPNGCKNYKHIGFYFATTEGMLQELKEIRHEQETDSSDDN